MASVKMCFNAPEISFSGKENTPQGLGYAASAEMVGKMMKGRDGQVYMVIVKNRDKTWKKVPEDMASRMTKEMPLLSKVVSDLKETLDSVEFVEHVELVKAPKAEPAKDTEPVEHVEAVEMVKKTRKPRAPKEKVDTAEPQKAMEAIEGTNASEDVKAGEPAEKLKKARKPRAPKEKVASLSTEEVEGDEPPEEVKKVRKPRAPKADQEKNAEGEETEVADGGAPIKKARKTRVSKKNPEGIEKKERKHRAPTEYNKFLSVKILELRTSQPGLKQTEYMRMAVVLWKEKKEQDAKKE